MSQLSFVSGYLARVDGDETNDEVHVSLKVCDAGHKPTGKLINAFVPRQTLGEAHLGDRLRVGLKAAAGEAQPEIGWLKIDSTVDQQKASRKTHYQMRLAL